ncbi:MAG TPA: hypothetical protein PKD91_09120 [Bacteroidia bacterium]|nr:hypothetical protein [Bacteroidia bacterium]
MTLTARAVPPAVAYTKNPILYAWETDMYNEYNDRMIMKIKVYYESGLMLIAELEKKPNTDNFFVFDISGVLDAAIQEFDILKFSELNWDDSLKKCSKTILEYRIEVVEYWGDSTDKDDTITPIEAWCVKGGLDPKIYPICDPFFEEYILDTQKFLTWIPQKSIISPFQPVTLFLYNYSGSTWNSLQAHFSLTLLDEATNTLSTVLELKAIDTYLAYQEILMIPAGPLNAELFDVDPSKKLIRYTLTIQDDETVVSETRTYILDYIKRNDDKCFAFLNSLGGIDHIRTTGRIDPKSEFSSGHYDRETIPMIADGTSTYDGSRALKADFNGIEAESIKIFSGPLTFQELEIFRDFRLSQFKFEYLMKAANPRYVPIYLDSKSFSLPKSNEYPYTLEFNIKHSFESKVFTPQYPFLK